jgi:Single-strand binding protein family
MSRRRGVSPWELREIFGESIVNHEVSTVHINKRILPGRIGAKGAELRYNAKGTPYCSLVVETDKTGPDGQVYTSSHKLEITGRLAEDPSVSLEPGAKILVAGAPHDRPTVAPKTPHKKTTCGLSTWGVSQRIRARATVERVGGTSDPDPVGLVGKIIAQRERADDRLRYPEQLRH